MAAAAVDRTLSLGKSDGLKTPAEPKGRIVLYTMSGCSYCKQAKSALTGKGLDFVEVPMESRPKIKAWLKERHGKTTVPQIFFNNLFVGGNEDLKKAMSDQSKWTNLIKELLEKCPRDDEPLVPKDILAANVKTRESDPFLSETDQYAKLVDGVRQSGIIRRNWRHGCLRLRNIPYVFSGKEFVDWMVTQGWDQDGAVWMGQQLVSRKFVQCVRGAKSEFKDDEMSLYRLLEHDSTNALNVGGFVPALSLVSGAKLVEKIRTVMASVYEKNLTKDGKWMNYKAILTSPAFARYVELSKQLQRVSLGRLNEAQRKSFFINIYNALVIHGILIYGTGSGLWQRYKFLNHTNYVISGHLCSLQDIQHGILRANTRGLGMLRNPFPASDPRLKMALRRADPRIHFAVNWGSKSCPPLKVYSPGNLDQELDRATADFLKSKDGVKVNVQQGSVTLPMVIKWFHVDFGDSQEAALRWVEKYLSAEPKSELRKLLDAGHWKIYYIPFDWGSNSQ